MPDPVAHANRNPRYGWDAPGIMLGMLAIGGAAVLIGGVATRLPVPGWVAVLGWIMVAAGVVPLALGLMMLQYGLSGKFRTREAILNQVAWRGDERVLDVGTGAGLLLIGAAQRLTRGGRATGIDIWAAKDLSNNGIAAVTDNLALTGMTDRAEVITMDAVQLDLADASVDVVLSLLCLHNIEPQPDQIRACREIARVLKPGGTVVIGDYVPTHGYARALAEAGLDVRRSRQAFGVAWSLMWLLVAVKPDGTNASETR